MIYQHDECVNVWSWKIRRWTTLLVIHAFCSCFFLAM